MESVHAAVNITNEERGSVFVGGFPFEITHSSNFFGETVITEQSVLGALALMPLSCLNHNFSALFCLSLSALSGDEDIW